MPKNKPPVRSDGKRNVLAVEILQTRFATEGEREEFLSAVVTHGIACLHRVERSRHGRKP